LLVCLSSGFYASGRPAPQLSFAAPSNQYHRQDLHFGAP
jgi:hypothetical protein